MHVNSLRYQSPTIFTKMHIIMKQQILLFAFVALSVNTVFSQIISKVYVVDTLTRLPIPFASIQYLERNYGTYTNDLGEFKRTKEKKIQISCVGYYSKTVELVGNEDTISLKPKIYTLKEITITPGKAEKLLMLGYSNLKSEGSLAQMPGTEIAVFIPNSQNKEKLLKSIVLRIDRRNIVLEDFAFVSVFKINIYNARNTKEIDQLINKKDLIYNSGILKRKTIIDISDLNLIIPKEGLFIGIEWVGKLNVNTHELDVSHDKSVEPFICLTFKSPNSVVFERSGLTNYSWTRVNSENWVSKLQKSSNGFTPCISITGY